MRQYAEAIRQLVPMSEAVKRYGFQPNRAGFISCPFHPEKTASLKVFPDSRGWYCFGCHAGGSVIDFVERLFGVGFQDAIRMIDRDFGLGLTVGKSYRDQERIRRKVRELTELQKAERLTREQEQAEYDYWLNEYIKCDIIKRNLAPKSAEDEIHELYAWAMHRLPVIEYYLDCLGGEEFG